MSCPWHRSRGTFVPHFEAAAMKIAVLHDWLAEYTGSERILEQIQQALGPHDFYTLVDFLPDHSRRTIPPSTGQSFIAALPLSRRFFRQYLPLMPAAVESLDFSDYDLVFTSSHATAKGALTRPDQLHISYHHQRNLKYAYDERPFYRSKSLLVNSLQEIALSWIRSWDGVASRRPDVTIAISKFVAEWQKHRHGVDCEVIYPPVDVDFFQQAFSEEKKEFYVIVSRLEPYKRVDLAVGAATQLGRELIVIGDGSRRSDLERQAGPTVKFLGFQSPEVIREYVSKAQAFLFPSREDFGIAPLESQACGTPVIALAQGGALETIRGLHEEYPTGVFFSHQTVGSLVKAVLEFEGTQDRFIPKGINQNVLKFNSSRFRDEIRNCVENQWERFKSGS